MSYNDLTELTLTADERLAEAGRILRIFESDSIDNFRPNEQKFLEQMHDAAFVSQKQLLWLRDLLQKIQ
jgi:hypothetical protein